MESQHTAESLKKAIKVLEIKQEEEGKLLKDQLIATYESLKPSNIIRNVVKEFYSSENLKNELVSTAISVTSGFIAKKLVIGKSNNQLLKLVGLAIQFGMTTLVSKKIGFLQEAVIQFINKFVDDKEEKNETEEPEVKVGKE